MRVLITGGTGLIGRALAGKLLASGHEVVILSRRPEKASGLPLDVRVAEWDGRSASGWGSLADGAGAIVNLAGENIAGGRWTEERKSRILESRLNAGRAVVQVVEQASVQPEVVIQASAVGYYGSLGDDKVTEESPPGRDFLAQVAVAWEDSTTSVEALEVRRVVTRSGVVLSREGGALPRMMLPFKLFLGGPLGTGKQWLSWVHIADHVAAVQYLLEDDSARGVFNVTAPEPVPNTEFSHVLGQAMKRPAVLSAPAFLLRLALGEMADVLLKGQRAYPRRLSELGFSFRFPEARTALWDLLR